jgi:hypothetical protein
MTISDISEGTRDGCQAAKYAIKVKQLFPLTISREKQFLDDWYLNHISTAWCNVITTWSCNQGP